MKTAVNFREQAIDLIRKVPPGRLVTYGQIARVLGRPRASRVVGGFLHSLPPDDVQTP
ncbi:MAG TPA: MGMT family protein [Phycisphaerales bacterium]|nr:MGMT family protein [Phycisphaerales bacterium]